MAYQSAPVELTPVAASLELRMLERASDRLQARVEGLREFVADQIKHGAICPWHHVESSESSLRWSVGADQILAMGRLMGVDLSKPALITPTQAKKAGLDASVIAAYSGRVPGKMKLVADNPADVSRIFNHGE